MNMLPAAFYNRLGIVKKIRREIAGHPRRDRVIDLGCGTGIHTVHLASIAGEVVGIDIDQKKIDTARKNYPHLEFYRMDAARTEFPDGRFDTAFMIMFLHETLSDEVIRECCRVAGEVVIIDYSRVLYGLTGRLIRLIEKDKYERYAAVNLTEKFAGFGFALREGRSIHPNFYIYFFARDRAAKGSLKSGQAIRIAGPGAAAGRGPDLCRRI